MKYELTWCFLYFSAIGVLSFFVGQALPKTWFKRGDELWFGARGWERDGKLYDRLAIRRWKDRVPDMSKLCRWMTPKAMDNRTTAAGLSRLIRETCVAELTHEVIIAVGFCAVLVHRSLFSAVLWLLWTAGNLLYVAIQRYNRPRLIRLRARLIGENTCAAREAVAVGDGS